MKVALINFNLLAIGTRGLSSSLRHAGIDTKMIFIPYSATYIKLGEDSKETEIYSDSLLQKIGNECMDCDVIGISLMNYDFHRSVQITKYLRKHLKKEIIVWGGIFATVSPEESLKYADFIFQGESENSFCEFLNNLSNGLSLTNISGLGHKTNGSITLNPPLLIQDLDTLPHLDYSFVDHCYFSTSTNEFVPLNEEIFKHFLIRLNVHGKDYLCFYIMASRGCKFSCTYCNNSAITRLYKTRKIYRNRSPQNVIDELLSVKSRFKYVNCAYFVDDDFTGFSDEYLEEFCHLYKENNIGMALFGRFTPDTLTEYKLKMLVDIGLIETGMGIEAGGEKIKKMYKRNFKNKLILKKAILLNQYRSKIKIVFSLITDNPFETVEDKMESIRLLIAMPKPFVISLFSLKIFEGTELFEITENKMDLLEDSQILMLNKASNQDYFILNKDYFNYLYFFAQLNIPKFISYILISKYVVKVFNNKNVIRRFPFSPMDFNRYINNFRLVRNIVVQKRFKAINEIIRIKKTKKISREMTENL